jgi:hypothetical protein
VCGQVGTINGMFLSYDFEIFHGSYQGGGGGVSFFYTTSVQPYNWSSKLSTVCTPSLTKTLLLAQFGTDQKIVEKELA